MRQTVTAIGRRWPTVLLLTLLGIGVGALAVTFQTPLHTATADVLVQQAGPEGATASPGERVVASYAAVLEGRTLTGPAAEAADVRDGLDDRVDATVRGDSDVIRVSVEAPGADTARSAADALLEGFQAWLAEQPGEGATTATVVSPAAASSSATSPDALVWIAIGALAGALLGLLVAAVRSTAPGVIGSADDATTLMSAPVLGTVAIDPDVRNRPLLTQVESNHPRREAVRILRTNLQFLDVDAPQQVITVTSALPAEGKTTTAANLAIATAETGRRVVLVDGDLRKPRLDELFGLERTVGLTTALVGRVPLDQAVQATRTPGLDILTSGTLPPNPSELLQTEAMIDLVSRLSETYDLVLIDAPPLLAITDGALLAALSDGALVVVRHGRTRQHELRAAADRLQAVGASVLGTVISMTPRRGTSRYGYGSGYGPEFFARQTGSRSNRSGRRGSRRR